MVSSLITSAWFWLFCLSSILVRGIATLRSFAFDATRILDIERHPIRSLGFVSMLAVTTAMIFLSIPFIYARGV